MNKKYLTITIGILGVAFAALSGFLWYTKTSENSNSQAQTWATYTQRLDSGDLISIDYPTGSRVVYGPDYGAAGEEKDATGALKKAPAYVLHFYSRDNAKTPANIVIKQHLPTSQNVIDAEKNALRARYEVKQSQWHLGEWTAYEGFIPSLNGNYLDDFYFNINGRSLEIEYSLLSESDRERIMSSICLNGIQMSKLDSMQGWDWPALSTSKWLTYTNTAGGYSIEYPSYLEPYTYDGIDLAMGGSGIKTPANEISVSLSPKGTYGEVIDIWVSRITYKTPDEWIAYINTVPGNVLKIQKRFKINGLDAILTASPQPQGDASLYIFLVQDGLGYQISGRSDMIASTTYEKVWSSFKLIPKN